MSELLEHVLRDALQKRSMDLDPGAAGRLLAVDYRPAQRRRVPLLGALGALGALAFAGAVAAAVLVITLGSGAAPAFAGWTAAPTHGSPAQTAAALKACGSRGPVLIETRGPFTAAVYAERDGLKTCVQGGSVSFDASARGVGEGSVRAGQIQAALSSGASSGHAFSVLDGRVGVGVTAVKIALSNGVTATATVSHGWYLVWWPGAIHATKAQITTASGTRTSSLPASATAGPPSCGPNKSCASVGPALSSSARG
jgi:hypothetical protein